MDAGTDVSVVVVVVVVVVEEVVDLRDRCGL